jgi:hypothetical protein
VEVILASLAGYKSVVGYRVSPTLQSEKHNSDVQHNSNCVDHERAKFIWPARSVFSVFETKFQQRNEA